MARPRPSAEARTKKNRFIDKADARQLFMQARLILCPAILCRTGPVALRFRLEGRGGANGPVCRFIPASSTRQDDIISLNMYLQMENPVAQYSEETDHDDPARANTQVVALIRYHFQVRPGTPICGRKSRCTGAAALPPRALPARATLRSREQTAFDSARRTSRNRLPAELSPPAQATRMARSNA